MTSGDREILVTIYENQVYLLKELQGLKTELGAVESRLGTVESEQQAIRTELRAVHEEQRVLSVRMDDLQTSVYWVLAALGIFIASLAVPAMISSLVSVFRKPQSQSSENTELISSLADAFTKVMSAGREHKD